jgi:3-dehydroquinate synthase
VAAASDPHPCLSVAFDYPVVFTRDLFGVENPALAGVLGRKEPTRKHRLLILVEEAVVRSWPGLLAEAARYAKSHKKLIELAGEPIVFEGGEACKDGLATALEVAERLNERGMDRQSFVMIIGGGAFLDMVGFAAAITHRGVRIVRVPTTVLAQADSAVGVKNGVNAFGKKNFLGTFAPPFAVVNDERLLESLPPRERVGGMSEAVKVALIKDPSFFTWIQANAARLAAHDHEATATLIRRSAQLHLDHIAGAGDPFELGTGRPLDFGHWSAHKLESLSKYEVRHGEAVAIGVAIDTWCSVEGGFLARSVLEDVVRLLEAIGFRLWDPRLSTTSAGGKLALLEGLDEFREHLGGELTITLLRDVGSGFDAHALDPDLVKGALAWLEARR